MKIRKLTVEIIPEYFTPGSRPILRIRCDFGGETIEKREIIFENDFFTLFEIMMSRATKEIIQEVREATNVK